MFSKGEFGWASPKKTAILQGPSIDHNRVEVGCQEDLKGSGRYLTSHPYCRYTVNRSY
ncbi:MAG: hypothetical protein A4E63_01634 [Syntrophorhabdus sp. PtaU1.Bin050]|nr:MAG: hypothetical protein A4E63_01634 [Syntrophorhabdus sp. PtaU1.Bin050]